MLFVKRCHVLLLLLHNCLQRSIEWHSHNRNVSPEIYKKRREEEEEENLQVNGDDIFLCESLLQIDYVITITTNNQRQHHSLCNYSPPSSSSSSTSFFRFFLLRKQNRTKQHFGPHLCLSIIAITFINRWCFPISISIIVNGRNIHPCVLLLLLLRLYCKALPKKVSMISDPKSLNGRTFECSKFR